MELEDHVGDIIAKARKGLGINTNQAANAAELNLTNYSRLEEDGDLESETNLSNLGKLLGRTHRLGLWEDTSSGRTLKKN